MELKPFDVYTTRGQIISELKRCIASPRKPVLLYKEDFIRIIEELEKNSKREGGYWLYDYFEDDDYCNEDVRCSECNFMFVNTHNYFLQKCPKCKVNMIGAFYVDWDREKERDKIVSIKDVTHMIKRMPEDMEEVWYHDL